MLNSPECSFVRVRDRKPLCFVTNFMNCMILCYDHSYAKIMNMYEYYVQSVEKRIMWKVNYMIINCSRSFRLNVRMNLSCWLDVTSVWIMLNRSRPRLSDGKSHMTLDKIQFIITVPMTRVGHLLGVSTGRNYLDVRFVIQT